MCLVRFFAAAKGTGGGFEMLTSLSASVRERPPVVLLLSPIGYRMTKNESSCAGGEKDVPPSTSNLKKKTGNKINKIFLKNSTTHN